MLVRVWLSARQDTGITLPTKTESDVIITDDMISDVQLQVMKDIDQALIAVGDESYPIQAAIAQVHPVSVRQHVIRLESKFVSPRLIMTFRSNSECSPFFLWEL